LGKELNLAGAPAGGLPIKLFYQGFNYYYYMEYNEIVKQSETAGFFVKVRYKAVLPA